MKEQKQVGEYCASVQNIGSDSSGRHSDYVKPLVSTPVATIGRVILVIVSFLIVIAVSSEIYNATVQEPLFQAAYKGDISGINRSLDLGANPRLPSDGGETALAIAVRGKYTKIVRVLLSHGGDPNDRAWDPTKKDSFNKTSIIDIAKRSGDQEIVQLLRQAGAKD